MYDIYGLGNALVDTEFLVEDDFLRQHQVAKGAMTLVEAEFLGQLSAALEDQASKRMSGGSAANSMYAAQSLGSKTYYSCKVADDPTGAHFLRDLSQIGIQVNDNARASAGISGECLILVTPDAERSMSTYLGISADLSAAEIDEEALAASKFFYVEGYLSSGEDSLAAAIHAREVAERAGVQTSVTLSDASMVNFFKDQLALMLGNGVDQLFCNEEEALAWAGTDRLDVAVKEIKDIGKHCNITLGARGSLSVSGDTVTEVPGYPVDAVDTNGAGDIYAGSYLAMVARGVDADQATRFANFTASHLVTQIGARLHTPEEYAALEQKFGTDG